jgi:hypothetical protein
MLESLAGLQFAAYQWHQDKGRAVRYALEFRDLRMTDAIAQFAKAKYLNLETFRKTGVGVRTPVWFAQSPDNSTSGRVTFYIYSEAEAGKAKRIRNNPKVRVAPCNFRGDLRGAWVDGRARLRAGDEVAQGQELLRRKYTLKIVGDFFGRLMRHKQCVIAIELN